MQNAKIYLMVSGRSPFQQYRESRFSPSNRFNSDSVSVKLNKSAFSARRFAWPLLGHTAIPLCTFNLKNLENYRIIAKFDCYVKTLKREICQIFIRLKLRIVDDD